MPSVMTLSATSTRSHWWRRCTAATSLSARWSRPRSPGSSGSTPTSTRSRSAPSTAPAARPASPRGGYFAGVPTMVKDNVDVAGMPTCEGTDTWVGYPARQDGDFARMYLATGLIPLGKTQLSEYGFSASAEHPRLGPVRNPWSLDHTAGALVGVGCAGRRRRRTDRPCQRRRRLDPDPCFGQRPGRVEADPRPAGPGQADARHAGADRLRRRGHPQRAGHRGVPPRGREGLPLAEAAPDRRHHPTRPQAAAGRRHHHRAGQEATPRSPSSPSRPHGLLEELGPHGRRGRRPACRTRSPTTSCSTGRRWPCS